MKFKMTGHILEFVSIIVFICVYKPTIAFSISTFFDRQPGDELIYYQTKVTSPTAQNELHRLEFDWRSNTQRFTQVKLEMNGYNSVVVYRQPTSDSFLRASVYHQESKQLIVTLLIYGFNETTRIDRNKNDDYIRLNISLLDQLTRVLNRSN